MADLKELRDEIDKVDEELICLLSKRMDISKAIGEYKANHGLDILDEAREKELTEHRAAMAAKYNLDEEFMTKFYLMILKESKRVQSND